MEIQGAHIVIMRDLFGDGILAVDGEKWRHQRKLASYEFSTRVLREYSSAVFRDNAAKLVAKVSTIAVANRAMDLQVKPSTSSVLCSIMVLSPRFAKSPCGFI